MIYRNSHPGSVLPAIADILATSEIRYNYNAPGLWWRKRFPKYNKPLFIKDIQCRETVPGSECDDNEVVALPDCQNYPVGIEDNNDKNR